MRLKWMASPEPRISITPSSCADAPWKSDNARIDTETAKPRSNSRLSRSRASSYSAAITRGAEARASPASLARSNSLAVLPRKIAKNELRIRKVGDTRRVQEACRRSAGSVCPARWGREAPGASLSGYPATAIENDSPNQRPAKQPRQSTCPMGKVRRLLKIKWSSPQTITKLSHGTIIKIAYRRIAYSAHYIAYRLYISDAFARILT